MALVAGFDLAAALTIGRYQRRLEEMAVTDKLTGIAVRAFAPLIEQLLSRSPQAVSLPLIDIDHFKQINDTRPAMTCCARWPSASPAACANPISSSAGVARSLLVVGDCAGENARHLADKICNGGCRDAVHRRDQPARGRISVGVAERTEDIDHLSRSGALPGYATAAIAAGP